MGKATPLRMRSTSGCARPFRLGDAVVRGTPWRFVAGPLSHRACVNHRRMVRIDGTIAGPSR